MIAGCARRMVEDGKAEPSMVMRDGVNTLHGLLPRSRVAVFPKNVSRYCPSSQRPGAISFFARAGPHEPGA